MIEEFKELLREIDNLGRQPCTVCLEMYEYKKTLAKGIAIACKQASERIHVVGNPINSELFLEMEAIVELAKREGIIQ